MNSAFSIYRKMVSSPAVAVHGRVATRAHVVDLMLDLVGYAGERTVSLLDPGCGEGAFVLAAAARLLRNGGVPRRFADVADSLLGVEKDKDAVAACRGRIRRTLEEMGVAPALANRLANHWIVEADFLEFKFDRQFDLVVGNPPYVRQEAIPKEDLERYRGAFECFYDRADLYVAFFEQGLKLLANNGRLAFICPDRFVKNNYGRKLRAFIADRFAVESVLDLAQASPFETEVTSYPGVFVIRRGSPQRHVDYFRLTDASPKECDLVRQGKSNGQVAYHRYDDWFAGEQQWCIESPAHLALLRRLESECVPIGNESSGCRVGIGVATGADAVFIMPQDSTLVERELLMPLVMTKDIAAGKVSWHGDCVINPFVGDTNELIDLKRFPRARAYLNRFRSSLEGRNVAKRDSLRWYRTIDRIYPSLRTTPKLLIPDIKAENLVVHERGELYPHHNLYYIASKVWDLRALRTILRSSLARFFVWMYGVKMRGDFLRFQAQYLRRICLPHVLFLESRAVAKLIAADAMDDPVEIDSVVASAYRLSDSELTLVRSIAPVRRSGRRAPL